MLSTKPAMEILRGKGGNRNLFYHFANVNKQIIRWWERRRIFYNMVMLAAGSITIILALLLHEIIFTDLINALPPVLIFALSVNLFYTLGWVVEIVCCKFI